MEGVSISIIRDNPTPFDMNPGNEFSGGIENIKHLSLFILLLPVQYDPDVPFCISQDIFKKRVCLGNSVYFVM